MENAKKTIEAGWKTSEFKVLVIGSVVAIANKAFGWHIDPETVKYLIALASSYIVGRSIRKVGTSSV